ncbi:hypothetical protein COY48_02805 [Candidatus Collierbacteria bacterium CG_4_10_14_0_8_um_filter_43_86]|uniref:Fido domain-containing protein n=2 Tax=Candidatus Collieribacteriota TaxID=1752725 RepID=A0A2H0DVS2_9BACT|nr:Fic family protein [bacterium]PIP85948.1 MAG: hypothetical protein COW83_01575 [Candidatus Collierbacteria bacterium CG22_combo_CG10-13_8_21_14_all_43_12]PIZ24442.1 MAG: hypothetical protein COY48_02805 [Candidatus Collierbacteria bacterium CG_4_10_14_0_8_um_filter_43_86]PJB48508.1 MAG: hypothetical protein CO104_01125 [Candidatus Collierbacteria bacterium CG_4_9_14_3_um_filter_43_16]
MFSPSFIITNKMLSNLIAIEVAEKIAELAKLQPDWEERLRKENLIRKIYSMSRFSANDLSLDDVAKIVKDEPGRDDKATQVAMRAGAIGKEKDIQQVLNLLNVNRLTEQLAFLAGKFKHEVYGEKELSQTNTLLGERLVAPNEVGSWREREADGFTAVPPLAVEVPFQIEDLMGWYKSTNKNEVHPMNKAGIMFYEIMRICPYTENNTLTALCFYQLILSSEGFGFKKLLSMEEDILKNKDSFQQAVSSVERNGGELTVWLEYLSRCLSEAAGKVQTKVMNLVGDTPIFKTDGGRVISLSERQIAIMEEITLKNEMTIKEIRNVLPMVSDDTILRDLKDLIDKKLIRKKGKTKGALYVMGKAKSYR